MPAKTGSQRTWWKDATVYQIWPASYKDSNGDGIGDIGGIISTLDYLKYLGIDIIWVSPMYDSPQDDMGYDVSNYEDIYPPYGTIQDAENLIHECHARDMRIVFDLVINHTSYLHAWFKESRSSKSNAKRDWYIWRPAKYDSNGSRQPPNNWRAHVSIIPLISPVANSISLAVLLGNGMKLLKNTTFTYLHRNSLTSIGRMLLLELPSMLPL